MLFESEVIDNWHRSMNKPEYVPPMGFRRNTIIYPLVCYINNIIGCYISKNLKPIPLFIERSRIHMNDNPPKKELVPYYSRVETYLKDLEAHLVSNGIGPHA